MRPVNPDLPVYSRIDTVRWDDMPVLLIGTGFSLEGFDLNRLRGLGHVIAVKEAWQLLDFYEVLFGGDLNWPRRSGKFDSLSEIAKTGRLWMSMPEDQIKRLVHIPGAHMVRKIPSHVEGFCEVPDTVHMGYTSGFAALNFAYHRRPRHIFLFGYDYRSLDGQWHTKGLNPWYSRTNNSNWNTWAGNFKTVCPQLERAGIDVVNVGLDSIIAAFEKVTHEQAIERLHRIRSKGSGRICGVPA